MRDVLISLKPYYYYLIGERIKKVEVRKSYPKADDWSKRAWFYMSRDEKSFAKIPKEFQEKYRKHFGKVGIRFVCDRITEYECSSVGFGELATTCGTCLTYDEILNYCNGNDLYGWHIIDLVVYGEPSELSEFTTPEWFRDCKKQCDSMEYMRCPTKDSRKVDKMCGWCRKGGEPITRPPMSWQFCVATEPRQTAD